MDQLHLITVNETADTRLYACGAELTICISGQSFFTGTEAFKKAAEVNRCVEAMKACGIEQDDILIQNVSTEVESGILTKSSSATYYLSVRCKSLDCLGPTLAAIASQKNTKLAELLWNFDKLEKTQNDLLRTAVKQAKATAQSIADALGTQCSALHKLSYDFHGVNQHGYADDLSAYASRKRKKISSRAAPLQQLNLEHNTKLIVEVAAEFVVVPFQSVS